jgi:S1-C subfamily serine protease
MFLVLVLATLACFGGGTPPVETETPQQPSDPGTGTPGDGLSSNERANLMAATVQIYALFEQNGELVPAWTGSGTILNKTGMILTNAHVAAPTTQGEPDDPDALAVALVQSEDKPPVFSYLAEVRAADGFLDFAVIQVVSTIDGDAIDPNSLNLPFVPLGNSDNVHVGDRLSIFGFPGIGGDTITFTDGSVSGFTSEDQVGDRAWIKTDATIAGGNSGGLAANNSAEIIGVPTIASSGADTDITDCRVVQDTNGDGQLTKDDTCIPIGGFINGVRPINLAMPLIKAAQGGQAYTSPYSATGITAESTGTEQITNLTWFTLGADGNLGEQVTSYPSGTTGIIAMFDYSGFTDGQAWGEVWTHNNEKVYEGTYPWDQGESGNYGTYLGSLDVDATEVLPDGNYHVEIFVDNGGSPLTTGDVVVGSGSGGGNTPPPSEGTVTLRGTVTDADTGKPLANVYVFVLSSGVTYDQWKSENWNESYVAASLKTTNNGRYEITGIPRNTLFTVVFSVEGYYDMSGDNLQFTASDPDVVKMDVQMSK